MADPTEKFGGETNLIGPVRRLVSVTPDDSNNLGEVSRAVYVGVSGDLQVTAAGNAEGTSVILRGLAGGIWHPVRVKRIWATSTTATGVVAGY